jgi:purine-cytosine permease-like protein
MQEEFIKRREERQEQIREIERDYALFVILTGLSLVIIVLLMLVGPSVWEAIDRVHPIAVLCLVGASLIFVIRFIVIRRKMW